MFGGVLEISAIIDYRNERKKEILERDFLLNNFLNQLEGALGNIQIFI